LLAVPPPASAGAEALWVWASALWCCPVASWAAWHTVAARYRLVFAVQPAGASSRSLTLVRQLCRALWWDEARWAHLAGQEAASVSV
jgi:hypothetical protein